MILPLLVFAQVSGVQFTSSISPHTVYVGQQVSYDGTMQVTEYAAARFQMQPDYTPPDVRGATVYDFPFDASSVRTVRVNGQSGQQFTYHRGVFPLAPGTYTISPATLIYGFPDPRDPYVSKSYTVHSEPQTFTVLPLPTAGKPGDFKGAVGRFVIKSHLPESANAGESFTLTATVEGNGNLDLLPRPVINIPWATVVNGPEQAVWDSSGVLVHGTKTFQWVINPRTSGNVVVPPIQYSYFDPETKRYATVSTAPASVAIESNADAGADSALGSEQASAQDPASATTPFPYLARMLRTHIGAFLGVLGAMIAGVVVLLVRRRRKEEERV